MLLIVEIVDGQNVKCICDCGNEKVVKKYHIRSGAVKSCGCHQKEQASKANKTHGKSRTKTYNTWSAMIQRCKNPKNAKFKFYGGIGVTVCLRWMIFKNFLEDMGERPEGLTLDRIHPAGNYEPGNCRWADKDTQAHNKKPKTFIVVIGNDRFKSLKEAAKHHSVSIQTISNWCNGKLVDGVRRTPKNGCFYITDAV